MLEKLFSNCVFNKKLAFSGYFEQSWKTFCVFAFNFIHVVRHCFVFEQQPGCIVRVVSGGAFTRNYIKIIQINASKYSNKHTPRVEAPCVVFLEQINCEFSSQILEGNRKITNDEFLSLCEWELNIYLNTYNNGMAYIYVTEKCPPI